MIFDPLQRPSEAVFPRWDKFSRAFAFVIPAEPVGKDLIPHSTSRPAGCGVVLCRKYVGHLEWAEIFL